MDNILQKHEMKHPAHTYGLILFALITLFNPNINVVDVLPDFIGFFILARLFGRGSDIAPHFEEAAVASRRAAILSLCKIPALFVIGVARGQNTMDNDIIVLMAVLFAALEIIFYISAAKNIFAALFYLGERTDASSLIRNDKEMCSDSLASLSYLLIILKAVAYALPETLRLTRMADIGSSTIYITGSKYYPYALITGLALTLTVGIAWLIRATKYLKGVKREGKFYTALYSLITSDMIAEHEMRVKKRRSVRACTLFVAGAVLFINLTFSNFENINIIPPFAALILISLSVLYFVSRSGLHGKYRHLLITSCTGAVIFSALSYVFEIIFVYKYGYDDLLYEANTEARAAYDTVFTFSVFEFLFTLAIFVLFFFIMKGYIRNNLGTHPDSQNYRITDQIYHENLIFRTKRLAVIASVAAFIRLVESFLSGRVMMVLTDSLISSSTSLITSVAPWMGLIVTAANLVFILYSLYYFSNIKDEIRDFLN